MARIQNIGLTLRSHYYCTQDTEKPVSSFLSLQRNFKFHFMYLVMSVFYLILILKIVNLYILSVVP